MRKHIKTFTKKCTAIALMAAMAIPAAFSTTAEAAGSTVIDSDVGHGLGAMRAKTYNKGGKKLQDTFGVTNDDILNLLHKHINDKFYLGTSYVGVNSASAGWYQPALDDDTPKAVSYSGRTDWRSPHGDVTDKNGFPGNDDVKGQAAMNCTGFVWDVIMRAQNGGGNSISNAKKSKAVSEIPCWGGVGAGTWAQFLRSEKVEYRTYATEARLDAGAGGTDKSALKAFVKSVVADGYIEPGDIVWIWGGDVDWSDGIGDKGQTEESPHVGIYIGGIWDKETVLGGDDGKYFNKCGNLQWWHSSYRNKSTAPGRIGAYNAINMITPKGDMSCITVIKFSDKGKVKLKKVSSTPSISNDNNCYSLKDAVYGVYTDENCTKKAGELKTDEKGVSNTLEVSPGKYWVKEITAPKGFDLNKTVKEITVKAGDTTTVSVEDKPGNDPASIELQKIDKDSGNAVAQGAASLAGAQFTVKYYDGYYTKSDLPKTAKRTWVIETKEVTGTSGKKAYIAKLDDKYKVSGDAFYKTESREVTLPLGTLTVEETKAPEGYLLEGSYLQSASGGNKAEGIYISQIKKTETAVSLTGGNIYSMSDKVSRGGVKVQKRDIQLDSLLPQGEATLEGAKFDIINMNPNAVVVDGKSCEPGKVAKTIITDKDGNAGTTADCLPYGDYKISESSAPEGYLNEGTIERPFSIKKDGEIVSLTEKDHSILNKVKRGGVKVQKRDLQSKDAHPEGGATLEGAKFDIINTSKNAVVVEDKLYDPGKVVKTIVTNEKGIAETTADCLPYGNYKISESSAPEGYLNKGILEREFSIREEGVLVSLTDKESSIINLVKRGDLEFVKIEGKTHKRMVNIPFRITSKTTKESHVAVTDDNGYFSTESSINAHSNNTNANDSHTEDEAYDSSAGIWFGLNEAGENVEVDDELGALPYDTYLVEELRCKANEMHELVPEFEIRVSVDQRLIKLGTVTDEIPDIPKEIQIHTTASSKEEESKTVKTDSKVTIVDTVTLKDLKIGAKYRLTGWQMLKEENAELKVDGKRVENTIEFTADKEDKEVQVEFSIDTSALGGSSLVTFEELYDITDPDKPEKVAEHKDITDEGQTVLVEKQEIQIHTTATGKDDASKTIKTDGKVTIVDTVTLKGLEVNKEYKLSGWQMLKKENAELKVDGKRVENDLTFTASDKDMEVQIEFTFDASALGGSDLVTFEELYDITNPEKPEKIAEHKDIEDEGQTVFVDDKEILIHTNATNKKDGSKTVKAGEKVTIIDTVTIEGLEIGKNYKLSGWQMLKDKNAELKIDGKRVENDLTFTAEAKDMEVQIEFTFDASALNGSDLVTFEELYDITEPEKPEKVAVHKDIEDEAQTVSVEDKQKKPSKVSSPVKTGDQTPLLLYGILAIVSLLSAIAIGIFIYRRKNNGN